ncbi:hypothetical protein DPMN_181023 [Dreissena polymorpha]|uniref:Uncharacterized protein n=1 Tax=Dreissena polymorpha TaxID=45954 RepID=A0A9D4DFF1_DREPO|nr:hypothetical protein DPMN_181023 [Dreissena polymorpha]
MMVMTLLITLMITPHHTQVHKDEQYKRLPPVNQYSIELNEPIQCCDIRSMLKASETLSFLVRDAAHVTPLNFESCVHAIRSFAEASLNGGKLMRQLLISGLLCFV